MADNLTIKVVWSMLDKITKPLKAIKDGGGATARALKETRDRLTELNTQQKAVGEFRALKNGLKESTGRLNQARQSVKELAQRMKEVEHPTRAMTREFDRAVNKATQIKQAHQQQSQQLQVLRDRIVAAGGSMGTLGQHERNLRNNIAATNAQLTAQKDKLAALTKQQERLAKAKTAYGKGVHTAAAIGGTGMAARATGMYTGEKLKAVLGVGYEFDAIMSSTQAVTRIADKNDEQMQQLRQQARTLPLSSKFTDSEVAQGQYFLGRTGYNPQEILGAMPGMLNLAAAGNMELGVTADIASNIQTAMGIPAEKMGNVADVLTAAFTRNNVDIQMLGESLKYSAGVGREYGQSLETVTAATALLGNAGVQGSMAGTSMRSVLTRVGNSRTVQLLGVNTKDASGNMRDLLDILKDINAQTKGMGNIKRGAIFKDIAGQYAVTSFGTLMRAVDNGQFQTMRGNLNSSEGEAAKVAATQLDNLKGDMTMLHAALENISVELFDKNSPWLRQLATDLSGLMHGVGEFLKEHPAVSKALVITVAGFAVLMTTLGTLTIGLAGILGPMIAVRYMLALVGLRLPGLVSLFLRLGTVFRFAGTAMLWLGRALLMNPIGLAITAIAILIARLYQYRGPIKEFLSGLWQSIETAFSGGLAAITALIVNWSPIGQFYRAFAAVMAWFGVELPAKFSQFGVNILQGLANGITNGLSSAKRAIFNAGASVVSWFKEKLDIHSPSRVFAELGEFTMQGLAQGLDQGQQGPLDQVSTLSRRVAQLGTGIAIGTAAMPGMAFDQRPPLAPSGSRASIDSHDTYQIIIQTAPGMDPNAIAAAVTAELDRRDRARRARVRSGLFDYDN